MSETLQRSRMPRPGRNLMGAIQQRYRAENPMVIRLLERPGYTVDDFVPRRLRRANRSGPMEASLPEERPQQLKTRTKPPLTRLKRLQIHDNLDEPRNGGFISTVSCRHRYQPLLFPEGDKKGQKTPGQG